MKLTANYKLRKPEGTDVVNIDDLNSNMDTLDVEVAKRVEKETGKGLSTNDYTTGEKNKLAGVATGANNYTHPTTHPASIITEATNKRFMTDAERSKLSGIEAGANKGLVVIEGSYTGDGMGVRTIKLGVEGFMVSVKNTSNKDKIVTIKSGGDFICFEGEDGVNAEFATSAFVALSDVQKGILVFLSGRGWNTSGVTYKYNIIGRKA